MTQSECGSTAENVLIDRLATILNADRAITEIDELDRWYLYDALTAFKIPTGQLDGSLDVERQKALHLAKKLFFDPKTPVRLFPLEAGYAKVIQVYLHLGHRNPDFQIDLRSAEVIRANLPRHIRFGALKILKVTESDDFEPSPQ